MSPCMEILRGAIEKLIRGMTVARISHYVTIFCISSGCGERLNWA